MTRDRNEIKDRSSPSPAPTPAPSPSPSSSNNARADQPWTDADRALIIRALLDTAPLGPEFYKRVEELLPGRPQHLVRLQWRRRIEKEIRQLFGGVPSAADRSSGSNAGAIEGSSGNTGDDDEEGGTKSKKRRGSTGRRGKSKKAREA
ncbi:uncharacterized protein PFL1_05540 [Pseudozyma flocculosa PF-1]|uniref:Uncharacterized protein n=1 Tax=Pseudozyma flocculosa PF-1 TaxID=1277687 RepID=A0A061H4K8_9BASI|nr:uncharacterized protein PFL1_05540 [Pseudozyma flocculosa PF-1]EPQ26905.1 hypothetical protein PFL1_05540 [Pseudozyma flocculosa PF-1]